MSDECTVAGYRGVGERECRLPRGQCGKDSGSGFDRGSRQERPWCPDGGSGFLPTMRKSSGCSLKVWWEAAVWGPVRWLARGEQRTCRSLRPKGVGQ